ncbi:epoxyqueuosine reductase [Acidimicrobium ferrooxidans]|uniref:epoxyqueuosine reductase n=1 Tax=Acidimicrobium ferrooxidans TaxID=53635 RepID=UPI0002EE5B0E|nr:epoxyqueuosine reductase [Acidimicrobium ferrooxidans]
MREPRFTFRRPQPAADPWAPLSWARGAIVVAVAAAPSVPAANHLGVAGYAAGDAYAQVRDALERVRRLLVDVGGRGVVVADSNLAFDRALARRARLGWVGRHTLVMVPGYGGAVVLGSLIVDRVVEVRLGRTPTGDPCRNCRRCVDACPTGALGDGVLEPLRCRSWRQQERHLEPSWRETWGPWLYGCDECVTACPLSARQKKVGGERVASILSASDAALAERVRSWYIPDRTLAWVRRNAIVAARSLATSPDDEQAIWRQLVAGAAPVRAEAVRWVLRRGGWGGVDASRARHQRLSPEDRRYSALPRGDLPSARPDELRRRHA